VEFQVSQLCVSSHDPKIPAEVVGAYGFAALGREDVVRPPGLAIDSLLTRRGEIHFAAERPARLWAVLGGLGDCPGERWKEVYASSGPKQSRLSIPVRYAGL
jgi:hypothetical protein